MSKPVIIFFSCLLYQILCQAQNHANVWYFAQYVGLDFNFNPPVILTDGKLAITERSDGESAATISDENGKLLFYTDGTRVWNKMHQLMPHGTGLWGSQTTTQTLIVPKPGDEAIYYIFTASPGAYDVLFPMEQRGFRYSIVDMDLNNGLGNVTEKNILLESSTTEKVAATFHANGKIFGL